MAKTSILEFLQELQSFVNVPTKALERAEASHVNSLNNRRLNHLIKSWSNGVYDEDPELLLNEVIGCL